MSRIESGYSNGNANEHVADTTDFYSILCSQELGAADWSMVIIMVCSVIAVNIYSASSLYKGRRRSPTKQRAPFLGVYHALQYCSLIVIPFLVEILHQEGALQHWKAVGAVPFDRRLLKFLYTYARIAVI